MRRRSHSHGLRVNRNRTAESYQPQQTNIACEEVERSRVGGDLLRLYQDIHPSKLDGIPFHIFHDNLRSVHAQTSVDRGV